MNTWGRLQAPDIPGFEELETAVATIGVALDTIEAAIDALSPQLITAEQVVRAILDPSGTAIDQAFTTLVGLFANAFDVFFENGFYFLPVIPNSALRGNISIPLVILGDGLADPLNPLFPHKLAGEDPFVDSLFSYAGITAVIDTLDSALRDTADYCRPTFSSTAFVGGAVLAISFDSPEDVPAAKAALDALMECTQLSNYLGSFNIQRLTGVGLSSNCTPPDFVRMSLLNLFPPLNQVLSALSDWAKMVSAYPSTYTQVWLNQLDQIFAFLNEIQAYAETVTRTISYITSLDISLIILPPEDTGTAGFVQRLRDASNQPTNDQMAAFVVMYGAENLADVAKQVSVLNLLLPCSV